MRRIAAVLLLAGGMALVPSPDPASSRLLADELTVDAQFAVAIERGDVDKVKELLAAGNKADTWIEYGEHKITPLMKACWEGQDEIFDVLVAAGADVNAKDSDNGETPLHYAVNRDRLELAKKLLAKGAKVNVKDARQFTALHKAAAAGNVGMIELLAGAKADPNAEMYGLTPLMFAVSAKSEPAVRALVAHGSNVNYGSKTGNVGQTALMSAIQTGDEGMVKLLLSLKANPNARTKSGETPLKLARNGDLEEIIKLLKAAGAK